MPVALITGASRGFGAAIARSLAGRGWGLVIDGRDATALHEAARGFQGALSIAAIPGDVADAGHREDLARAVRAAGRLDLLVNNASDLGTTPLPPLSRYPVPDLERVFRVNAFAPLALIQLVLPELRSSAGIVVDVSSDAAVEAYPGWGGYGASKAALDQITAVVAAEEPAVAFYAFDPGDMRTATHQAAYPGEDISDRADPGTVVPALLHLIEERPHSGRFRAADLALAIGAAS